MLDRIICKTWCQSLNCELKSGSIIWELYEQTVAHDILIKKDVGAERKKEPGHILNVKYLFSIFNI